MQSTSDSELDASTVDGLREEVNEHRDPGHDVDPLFVNRWSPRAMTGERVADEDLMALFEAARWAPSSYNNQHWRFVYATPADDAWDDFVALPNEHNREWAADAGALVVILAKTTFDHNGDPAPTHSFDTGAAWENFALEGARRGLVVHGMQGFDADAAAELFDLPDEYAVEVMAAVGIHDDSAADDEHPNQRKDLDEIVFNGDFTPN
jgi:nitroreductase